MPPLSAPPKARLKPLTEDQLDAIQTWYYLGWSSAKIARRLDVNESTARRWLKIAWKSSDPRVVAMRELQAGHPVDFNEP